MSRRPPVGSKTGEMERLAGGEEKVDTYKGG